MCLNAENYRHKLQNVLYVKALQTNFISVSKALERGFKVIFEEKHAFLKDENNSIIMKAKECNNLFIADIKTNKCLLSDAKTSETIKWHNR